MGEFRIVTDTDLDGLGASQDRGTLYTWTRPSLMLYALPWLGVLLLLMLPANRTAAAWWIGLALLAVEFPRWFMAPLFPAVPAEGWEALGSICSALAFGVAAAWLTLPNVSGLRRPLDALGLNAVLIGFCFATYGVRTIESNSLAEWVPAGAVCGMCGLLLGSALSLAAWFCHRSFNAVRFAGAILVCDAVGWAAIISVPFALSNGPGIWEALAALAIATLLSFALVVPFVVLSAASPFYGERLRAFASGGPVVAPAPVIPAGPAGPAAAQPG